MDASTLHIDELLAHAGWARGLARRLLGDAAAADDAVQEALLAALQHSPPSGTPPRAWLGRVIGNVIRMQRRGERRRRWREEAAPTSDPPPTPESLYASVAMQKLLGELVLEQPEPVRTVLLLRYYQGLNAAEIAAQLGEPAGTVRWRLKQGVDAIEKELDRRHPRRTWALMLIPLLPRADVERLARPLSLAPLAIGAAALLAVAVALVLSSRAASHAPSQSERSTDISQPAQGALRLASPSEARFRIAGRVTREGQPVSGATVELRDSLGAAKLLTGSDGIFDLGERPAAVYHLGATAEGSVADAVLDVRDPAEQKRAAHLELKLLPCAHELSGTVEDASGGPIVGARVRTEHREVTAEAGGRYQICVDEDSLLTVEAAGYGSISEREGPFGRRAQRSFQLSPEVVLGGQVLRSADGSPVSGAEVHVVAGDFATFGPAERATVTAQDGAFSIAGVAAGRLLVQVEAPGLVRLERPLIAVVGHGESLRLALAAAVRVDGVVLEAGKPVVGAAVSAGTASDEALTGVNGAFTLRSAPAGPVEWSVTGYEVLKAKPGPILDVRSLGVLRGQVRRDGIPQAGVRVWQAEPGFADTRTDDEGRFTLRGLSAGPHRLRAAGDDATGQAEPVELARCEVREHVDIELSCSDKLPGIAIDPEGKPLAGLSVIVYGDRADPEGLRAVTSLDGSFELKGLCGGWTKMVAWDRLQSLRSQWTSGRLVVQHSRSSIAGRVLDAAGVPLPDVVVRGEALAVRPGSMAFSSGVSFPHAISTRDGSFNLADLPDGSYQLWASAADGSEATATVSTGTQEVALRMAAPGSLEGTLTGFTVPPSVSVERRSGPQLSVAAVVDAGRFRIAALPPGRYQVQTVASSQADSVEVEVRSGAVTTAALKATGVAHLNGRVLELRSGDPIANARCVTRLSAAGMPDAAAVSEADGSFSFGEVPASRLLVTCQLMEVERTLLGEASINLEIGQTASVQVLVVRPRVEHPLSMGLRGESDPEGLRISSVVPGRMAAASRLQAGDLLVEVEGRALAGLGRITILALLGDHAGPFPVAVKRQGATLTVEVRP